jgi:hypothetical protein
MGRSKRMTTLQNRSWIRLAVASQMIAAAYLQAVEWIDLFPWNDLAKGNMQERLDVMLLLSQLFVALTYARRWLWWMIAGWVAYAVWLYLQIESWWVPYLWGGRSVGPNWYFARTFKFLPAIGDRPTPDANHFVLQLLIIAVLATSALAIWQQVRARRRERSPFTER